MESCPILFPTHHSSSSTSFVQYPSHLQSNSINIVTTYGSSSGNKDDQSKVSGDHGSVVDHKPISDTSDIVQKKGKKQEKKMRRPRLAFQTRSRVDILDDGYRWRKYGQKAVKNNTFPRSYYRCTHQDCNVKKQVQRLSRDENIVVTTYEGTHTHPIEKPNDSFEDILNRMQIYANF
ncbi:probable WRKY transcription factor 43 [Zingiber officinale]|uniref:probable WRKY transcription factor 43 n=1 Tax=Zingiber officinale TaxID=94328 RepID=UPI001C4B05B9|nr:probable WRKY transcription factor 43 [Zingiber officinale]